MLRTYSFLDTQGRLVSRCCGYESHIWNGKYGIQSMVPLPHALCHHQMSCSTHYNINAAEVAVVPYGSTRATGMSSLIQHRHSSCSPTSLTWKLRFMDHAIKNNEMNCNQESSKHTENDTLERAHSRELHWSPRVQSWAWDAPDLCGHRISHCVGKWGEVTGPESLSDLNWTSRDAFPGTVQGRECPGKQDWFPSHCQWPQNDR